MWYLLSYFLFYLYFRPIVGGGITIGAEIHHWRGRARCGIYFILVISFILWTIVGEGDCDEIQNPSLEGASAMRYLFQYLLYISLRLCDLPETVPRSTREVHYYFYIDDLYHFWSMTLVVTCRHHTVGP